MIHHFTTSPLYAAAATSLLHLFTSVRLSKRKRLLAGHHGAHLAAHHFFPDRQGDEGFAVVDVEGDADHLGEDGGGAGGGLGADDGGG